MAKIVPLMLFARSMASPHGFSQMPRLFHEVSHYAGEVPNSRECFLSCKGFPKLVNGAELSLREARRVGFSCPGVSNPHSHPQSFPLLFCRTSGCSGIPCSTVPWRRCLSSWTACPWSCRVRHEKDAVEPGALVLGSGNSLRCRVFVCMRPVSAVSCASPSCGSWVEETFSGCPLAVST